MLLFCVDVFMNVRFIVTAKEKCWKNVFHMYIQKKITNEFHEINKKIKYMFLQ